MLACLMRVFAPRPPYELLAQRLNLGPSTISHYNIPFPLSLPF